MGCMCRCAPPLMTTVAPLPPTSLAAARPPSLLPPPFRADGDPPFYALAGERKGRSVFVYNQHKLSYLKNTFCGGHKPSFRRSRALSGLLTSPPPVPFQAPAQAPCAIDLSAADSWWLPATVHLLVFLATFHGPRMRQVRRYGDGRWRAARLPEDSLSPPTAPMSLHVQSMCFAHSMHTQGAGRIVGRLFASD